MIPELGQYALILALVTAVVQAAFPLAGAALGNRAWVEMAWPAARAQCAMVCIAFACLSWAFATNDFSVAYVAQNSNSLLPLRYRLSAVWGAHEGSLLLWTTILGLWTVAVSIFSRGLPRVFTARVLSVMGLVSIGFLLFMLLTSNPFARLWPAAADGVDLNPLLQDPGLILHPPILYTGYVGFSVAFGFAIAALLGRQVDPAWARWSRPWTALAWTFLTLGIAGGSYWSYYELGWGGWWFWDPVENASFMPWLVGTALLHSLAATEKRGVFKNWTVLLAICAFSLSLLGTFLVRSGVLTSIHAFASDPARGVFILTFLSIVVGSSLVLYALRAPGIRGSGTYAMLSRETLLLTNSVLLVTATAAVLLGTVYPLFIEAMGGNISVGTPYFNSVFVPLMVPVIAALGVGVVTRWRADDARRIWTGVRPALFAGLVMGVLFAVAVRGNGAVEGAFAILFAAWIVGTNLAAIHERVRGRRGADIARSLPRGFIGMCFAHCGLAVTLIGIAVSSNFSVETHRRMSIGDAINLGPYTFTLQNVRGLQGPNYRSTEAVLAVSRGGHPETTLVTEKRDYEVRGQTMTEAGISAGLTRDLYASLGEPLGSGAWSMRLYFKPMVRWIWLGAIFMALGGLLAATDRRYRLASVSRQPAQARDGDQLTAST